MSYVKNLLQVTTLDGKNPAAKLHEDAGNGSPVCNMALRPYKGEPTRFTSRGPGEVTCGKCGLVRSR